MRGESYTGSGSVSREREGAAREWDKTSQFRNLEWLPAGEEEGGRGGRGQWFRLSSPGHGSCFGISFP